MPNAVSRHWPNVPNREFESSDPLARFPFPTALVLGRAASSDSAVFRLATTRQHGISDGDRRIVPLCRTSCSRSNEDRSTAADVVRYSHPGETAPLGGLVRLSPLSAASYGVSPHTSVVWHGLWLRKSEPFRMFCAVSEVRHHVLLLVPRRYSCA